VNWNDVIRQTSLRRFRAHKKMNPNRLFACFPEYPRLLSARFVKNLSEESCLKHSEQGMPLTERISQPRSKSPVIVASLLWPYLSVQREVSQMRMRLGGGFCKLALSREVT
jgi:hypothetical protein